MNNKQCLMGCSHNPANVQQTSSWPDGIPPLISLSVAYPAAYQLWAKP